LGIGKATNTKVEAHALYKGVMLFKAQQVKKYIVISNCTIILIAVQGKALFTTPP
jgi:hypothetical protein